MLNIQENIERYKKINKIKNLYKFKDPDLKIKNKNLIT